MTHAAILLLLLLLLLFSSASSFKILDGLRDISVPEGSGAKFFCKFSEKPEYAFWFFRSVASVGFSKVSFCGRDRCQLYGPFREFPEISLAADGGLMIQNAKRRNDGVYKCSGLQHGNEVEASARLTVLVPPDKPTLKINRTDVIANQPLALICTSTSGNPAPVFDWTWNRAGGSERTDLLPEVQAPSQTFGAALSLLHLRPVPEDHLATVRCSARNAAGSSTSEPLLVRVNQVAQRPEIKQMSPQLRDGTEARFFCAFTGGNPPPLIQWRWRLRDGTMKTLPSASISPPAVLFGKASSTLAVLLSSSDHDALVTCEASNKVGNATTRSLKLFVTKPPSRPELTASVLRPREGDRVVFTCSSSGGNPAPNFTWSWTGEDGRPKMLPPASIFNHVLKPPSRPFGVASSLLSLLLTFSDDRSELACSAANDIGERSSKRLEVAVLYRPRIKAFPFDPLLAIEGSPLALHCVVRANPLPRVLWRRRGIVLSESRVLTFRDLSRRSAGDLHCNATNDIGSAQLGLNLQVLYAPTISVPPTITLREDDPLAISCRVASNPPARIFWRGPDNQVLAPEGPMLQISSVTRHRSGGYTCEAENVLTPSEGKSMRQAVRNSTQVIVKYLPSWPVVSISPSGSVVVNSEVVFLCSANEKDPGFPAPSLEWRRLEDDFLLSSNGTFHITSASLRHSGRFQCSARNEIGTGPRREVELKVEEPPIFLRPLQPPALTLRLRPGDVDFSMTCTVRGKPKPEVKWSKDGVPLSDVPSMSSHYREVTDQVAISGGRLGYEVTSVLSLQGSARKGQRRTGLLPEDNARFACEASNRWGRNSSALRLTVQYPPQFEEPPRKVAADLERGVALLSCPVSAVPAPNISEWFLSDGQRVGAGADGWSGKYSVTLQHSSGSRLWDTRLAIRGLTPKDLGLYRCVTRNALGNNSLTIELRQQSVPERPSVFLLDALTWESALLSWRSGFDGGFVQSFELAVESSTQEFELEGLRGARHNLTGLFPNRTYAVRLRAKNKLGASDWTTRLPLVTPTLFLPPIEDVRLDLEHSRIMFKAANGFCVRLEVSRNGGRLWLPFRACLEPSLDGERVTSTAEEYRAALCLPRRPDVCSEFVRARLPTSLTSVPLLVIIAVAVACAVLITVLLSVLLFFCLRRKRPRRKEDASGARRGPQAITINPYAPNRAPPSSASKPFALVVPTSAGAFERALENGASKAEKARATKLASFGDPAALSPPSTSSQDPLCELDTNWTELTTALPCDPPPYTDSVRRPASAQRIEMQEAPSNYYPTWSPGRTDISGATVKVPKKIFYEVVV